MGWSSGTGTVITQGPEGVPPACLRCRFARPPVYDRLLIRMPRMMHASRSCRCPSICLPADLPVPWYTTVCASALPGSYTTQAPDSLCLHACLPAHLLVCGAGLPVPWYTTVCTFALQGSCIIQGPDSVCLYACMPAHLLPVCLLCRFVRRLVYNGVRIRVPRIMQHSRS